MKVKKIIYLFAVIGLFILLCVIGFLYIKHKSQQNPFPFQLNDPQGYFIKASYYIGEKAPLFFYSSQKLKLNIFSLGDSLEFINDTFLLAKTQSNIFDPLKGYSWVNPYLVKTDSLKTGYYFIRMEHIDNPEYFYCIPFIIKEKNIKTISIISSTNTWQAYNSHGGISSYTDFRTPWYLKKVYSLMGYEYLAKRFLPFLRPYHFDVELAKLKYPTDTHYSHQIRGEWNIVAFLRKNKFDFNLFSDYDFAFDKNILKSDLLIFQVHTEYWSKEMTNNLKQFQSQGGHVIFLGGDNMTREVEFYENGIAVLKKPTDSLLIEALIGSSFTGKGFNTFAPYQVEDESHWVFKGLNIKKGDVFGKYSSNNNGNEFGASGWETDKSSGKNPNTTILAKGLNNEGPAHMVFTAYPQGGWLFNSGSISFAGALGHDGVIDSLMLNLITNAIIINTANKN